MCKEKKENKEKIIELAHGFQLDDKTLEKINKSKENLLTFQKLYPYRCNPSEIDNLTGERLYNPGSDDYFFLWIEQRTKNLGAISVFGGVTYPNAVENLDKFRYLLKILVDDNREIHEKIDAGWEGIRGFGGDRTIAKKILFCFYSERLLPIFKTDHLESFVGNLEMDRFSGALAKYNKNYKDLSLGEKFDLLQSLLLSWKESELPEMENNIFTWFIYSIFAQRKLSNK